MSRKQHHGVVVDLGSVLMTRGAAGRLNRDDVLNALLVRHMAGDWGDVGIDDWKENDFSLKNGLRILSSYVDRGSERFWIITEADRSSTTILLPDEY